MATIIRLILYKYPSKPQPCVTPPFHENPSKKRGEIVNNDSHGCFNNHRKKDALHHILRPNREVLTVFSHVLKLLISTAWLAHIERIFPSIRHPRWIIAIIIDHPPEDRVPVTIRQPSIQHGRIYIATLTPFPCTCHMQLYFRHGRRDPQTRRRCCRILAQAVRSTCVQIRDGARLGQRSGL